TEVVPQQRERRQVRRDRNLALPPDPMLQLLRIGGRFPPRRAEVDRKQGRCAVQQFEPALVDFWRQVMPLGIVLVRSELGMMIQMPSRELAGHSPAWNRIEQPEDPLGHWPPPCKNRVMHDLVQENREVKDRQSLNECQRYPDQGILETNQAPRGERENAELSSCHDEMPPGNLLVELAHLVARDRSAQLSSERYRVLGVIVGLHGNCLILAGIRPDTNHSGFGFTILTRV